MTVFAPGSAIALREALPWASHAITVRKRGRLVSKRCAKEWRSGRKADSRARLVPG